MEINHLREFVVLAETGNFLEASDLLYISQSTLSKHIKSLELELGVLLFDRTTRKVHISKQGQLLLPYARQIAGLQEDYAAILKSSVEVDQEVLALGYIYGFAQYRITDVLVEFKKQRPHATVNVVQDSSQALTEMLRQRKCDLAFIRDIEDEAGEFVQIPYATDVIVAVLPLTHPLASQKSIPLRLLADESFVLAMPPTMPYRLSMKACEQSGFEPRVAYHDPDAENLIDLVTKGMGIALVLKHLAAYHSNPRTAIVDITPGVISQIGLCYLKGPELSDAARHFVVCAGSQTAKSGLLDQPKSP